MIVTWDKSYSESGGKIAIEGNSTSSSSDFKKYLQTDFQRTIKYYLGDESFEELINNLRDSGFDTSVLETALNSPSILTFWEWGECFAYDQIEKHLGINIPWPPFWDRRIRKASLPGGDIVGLMNDGQNTIFVFGEIKTSSQKKYPPDVVIKSHDGMIDQIQRLASRETIKDHIQWLYIKAEGKDWEEDFRKAMEYYIKHNNGHIVIGILIRDTAPNVLDLRCILEKLEEFKISTSCYSYYLPLEISACMAIHFNGGGLNATL